jgi:hypothetical protein
MRALAVNIEVEKYFFGIQNLHCKLLGMLKIKKQETKGKVKMSLHMHFKLLCFCFLV